jgi:hypothetical protein
VELCLKGNAIATGLLLVAVVTLALSVPPFSRVGARDEQGNEYYRQYFSADFVWHMAMTAELTKFTLPPTNPILAPEPIHYYWTYFLVPAAVAQTGPPQVRDVELCLKGNAIATGLLLMGAVFVLAWTAVPRAAPVTAAVILALVAASAEGLYETLWLWLTGQRLALLRETNIDAIVAWHFRGHRIDGLPRCLWYVPQHSMAYALGLVGITAAAGAGSSGRPAGILLAGLALGGATAMNPFVGGLFALVYGAAIVLDALARPGRLAAILRHGLAAIPVLLAVLWCVSSRMVEGAGNQILFGFGTPSRHAPVTGLLLSLGPILCLAAAGVFVRRVPRVRAAIPAGVLALLSLVVMYTVRLFVDVEWVPFRAGQMFLVAAPALAARALAAAGSVTWRRATAAVYALLFVIGLPTTLIDAYNAADIGNRLLGPGFHWTLVLPIQQVQAYAWIRRSTPPDAVVQMEPLVRERDGWSLIPTFAERRMAAGLPISLMRIPAYRDRSERVRVIFDTPDPQEAWHIARDLGIDYIYVDELDRQKHPAVEKFDRSPQFFSPGFKRGAVGVYQVK